MTVETDGDGSKPKKLCQPLYVAKESCPEMIRFIFVAFAFAFAFAGGYANAGQGAGLSVDCAELDSLLKIGITAAKFERAEGEYRFDSETFGLHKYGFEVFVPFPKRYRVKEVSPLEGAVRLVPRHAVSGSTEAAGLAVHPFEIRYSGRDYLSEILLESDFEKFRNVTLFDFLVKSLGNSRRGLRCDNQEKFVAMFMSSYVKPFNDDGVDVYSVPGIKALLLVSKNKEFRLLKLVYPKGLDTLVFVNIEGDPEQLTSYLRMLKRL